MERARHRKIFDQLLEVHILCALVFDADLRWDLLVLFTNVGRTYDTTSVVRPMS